MPPVADISTAGMVILLLIALEGVAAVLLLVLFVFAEISGRRHWRGPLLKAVAALALVTSLTMAVLLLWP